MAFLQDVGTFFNNLGTGITTTVQGFGENIQSQAELNEAQALAIRAAAQTAEQRLFLEAEEKRRRDKLLLIIVIAIVAAPIVGIAIYYGLKK